MRFPTTLYFDPEFAYLYNGGVITSGGTPGHWDHPGTSLQWITGLISRLTYLFHSSKLSFSQDLVSNPDIFLLTVRLTLALLFCFCLFIFGVNANKYLGMHLGLATILFICAGIKLWYPWIYFLTPESLVASTTLLILALLLPCILNRDNQPSILISCCVGLAFAFGITGKVIILPLFLLLPFVLRAKEILVVGVITIVTSLIILKPVYPRFGVMYNWFKGVASSPDRYGNEDSAKWTVLENFRRAIRDIDGAYPFAWLIVLVLIAASIIVSREVFAGRIKEARLTFFLSSCGVTLAIIGTLGMGYKSFNLRDFIMIPFLAPLLMSVVLFKSRAYLKYPQLIDSRRFSSYAAIALISVSTFLSLRATLHVIRSTDSTILTQSSNIKTLDNAVGDSILINAYPSSSLEFASSFGNAFSSNFYSKEIFQRFPNYLELNIWDQVLYGYKSTPALTPIDCLNITHLLVGSRIYLVIQDHILTSYWPDRTDDIVLANGFSLKVSELRTDLNGKVFKITGCG